MMAGLPKHNGLILFVVVFIVAVSSVAWPQETQPLVLTQESIVEALAANPFSTEKQTQPLVDSFSTAVEASLLSLDQAMEMLALVGWESIESEEDISQALALLEDTLRALLAGEIIDPLSALTEAYNTSLTPDGILHAVSKAGASEETLSQVQSLIAAGLPPGIVLRVTQNALRQDLPKNEIDRILADLASIYAEGASPGQAANQAIGRGSYKHQEHEEEQNTNQDEEGLPEEETNRNGPKKPNNGKKDGTQA